MKYYNNIIDMIGDTSLVKLDRLFPDSQVFAKCELMNPLRILLKRLRRQTKSIRVIPL